MAQTDTQQTQQVVETGEQRESVPGMNVTRGQMSIERGKTRVYELMLAESYTRTRLIELNSMTNHHRTTGERTTQNMSSQNHSDPEAGGRRAPWKSHPLLRFCI